ncbi:MAG: hypothetical protein RMY00_29570 [Nostoc sp. ChiVER01]|nr:hypothetical protein [Nostoc sp. ChiVER01]
MNPAERSQAVAVLRTLEMLYISLCPGTVAKFMRQYSLLINDKPVKG